MMNWIIAYDIANKRRLQQTHRYLSNIAIPLQNSTFLFTGNQAELERHFMQLTQKLNRHEDDVRVYPMASQLYCLGKPVFPQGILLADFPEQSLATSDKEA